METELKIPYFGCEPIFTNGYVKVEYDFDPGQPLTFEQEGFPPEYTVYRVEFEVKAEWMTEADKPFTVTADFDDLPKVWQAKIINALEVDARRKLEECNI